jgi:hypothetical protein
MGGIGGDSLFKDFYREVYATVFSHFTMASGHKFTSIASKAECDLSYLYAIRDGSKLPSLEVTRGLDSAIGAGGLLVEVRKLIDRLQTTLRTQAHTGRDLPAVVEENEMERRRLLQSLAALGIAITPLTDALETIRRRVDRALDGGGAQQVGEWEQIVAEYGYAYVASPPRQLVSGIAADLVAVQSVMDRIDEGDPRYRDWSRISGGLATLMAACVADQDGPRAARHWWGTAQRAADASADLDLRLQVRHKRIVHGLYEGRPLPALLREAAAAEELAGGHACAGLAGVRSGRAQLLALDGQQEAARAELRRAEEVFGRLPASVTSGVATFHGWAETRLRFTETFVNAYLGREAETDTAAGQALKLYPAAHRAAIQIELLQALSRVTSGDITEGVRHAHQVYSATSPEQRNNLTDDTARRVVQCVPSDQRQRREVAAYYDLVA